MGKEDKRGTHDPNRDELTERVLESLIVGAYPGYHDLVAARGIDVEQLDANQIQELSSDEAIGRFVRSAAAFAVAMGQEHLDNERVSRISDNGVSVYHNVVANGSEGIINIRAHKLETPRTSDIYMSYIGTDHRMVKFALTDGMPRVDEPPCFFDESFFRPPSIFTYPNYNYFFPKDISRNPEMGKEFLLARRWVASGLITASLWNERMVFPLPDSSRSIRRGLYTGNKNT